MLHDKEINKDILAPTKDRNTKEVEAEGIAFTVCSRFEIDTSDYFFHYIAGWSSGRDMKVHIPNYDGCFFIEKCPLLLGHEKDICGKFTRRLLSSFEIQPTIKVEAENIALILGLCANGLGGCFSPEIIVRNTLAAEQLKEVFIITLGKDAEYEIRIGWKDNWNIIQSFMETAKEILKSGVKF